MSATVISSLAGVTAAGGRYVRVECRLDVGGAGTGRQRPQGLAQFAVARGDAEAAQDALLALGPETGHRPQSARPDRLGKLAGAGDAEVSGQPERPLKADAGDLRELPGARRHPGPQLVHSRDRAGPPVLHDLRGDRRPDAGDLGERGVRDRGEVLGIAADRLGRPLVGPCAELVAAGERDQVSILAQQGRDFLVKRRHNPILSRRAPSGGCRCS
jgi:hypothetical protein